MARRSRARAREETTSPDHQQLYSGFTLIELMVVVMVLSVLTAMIVPQFAGTYQAALLRSTARRLVTAVRLASSEAVTRNRQVRLVIDPERHRYWMDCREQDAGAAGARTPITSITDVPGASGELHEKITIQVRSPRLESSRPVPPRTGRRDSASDRGQSLLFHPDGTTERREIILRDQQGFGVGLQVHPTTARVRIVELEPELRMRPAADSPVEFDRRPAP